MAGGGGETYTLTTQASATSGNAILRLDGDESAAQDIEIVGGNNITVTQAGNNQLTINATGDLTPDLDVGTAARRATSSLSNGLAFTTFN